MPEVALSFRAMCGCFVATFIAFMSRRAMLSKSLYIPTLKLGRLHDGVTVGLLLAYLYLGVFLHRCGDVELNPGPGPSGRKDSLRQTQLNSGAGSASSSPKRTSREPTLRDVAANLQELTSMFKELKEEVRQVKETCSGILSEMASLKETITDLKQENQRLKEENEKLCEKVEKLELKTDDLEGHSKRNNILFYGIPRQDNETRDDCEKLIKDLLTDKLGLSRDMEFDRIHRLNRNPNSPIIGRCAFYRDKEMVLKAKCKLRGSNVFIGEDFTPRVRDIRRKLVPHLKDARKDGKRAFMVFDHLIIDGKKLYLNESPDPTNTV